MNYTRREPCGNCPYLKSAPLMHWAREEYERAMASHRSDWGAMFGCHKGGGEACAGWLQAQRNEGIPSLRLRVAMIQNPDAVDAVREVSSEGCFSTVREMCEANLSAFYLDL